MQHGGETGLKAKLKEMAAANEESVAAIMAKEDNAMAIISVSA